MQDYRYYRLDWESYDQYPEEGTAYVTAACFWEVLCLSMGMERKPISIHEAERVNDEWETGRCVWTRDDIDAIPPSRD